MKSRLESVTKAELKRVNLHNITIEFPVKHVQRRWHYSSGISLTTPLLDYQSHRTIAREIALVNSVHTNCHTAMAKNLFNWGAKCGRIWSNFNELLNTTHKYFNSRTCDSVKVKKTRTFWVVLKHLLLCRISQISGIGNKNINLFAICFCFDSVSDYRSVQWTRNESLQYFYALLAFVQLRNVIWGDFSCEIRRTLRKIQIFHSIRMKFRFVKSISNCSFSSNYLATYGHWLLNNKLSKITAIILTYNILCVTRVKFHRIV